MFCYVMTYIACGLNSSSPRFLGFLSGTVPHHTGSQKANSNNNHNENEERAGERKGASWELKGTKLLSSCLFTHFTLPHLLLWGTYVSSNILLRAQVDSTFIISYTESFPFSLHLFRRASWKQEAYSIHIPNPDMEMETGIHNCKLEA